MTSRQDKLQPQASVADRWPVHRQFLRPRAEEEVLRASVGSWQRVKRFFEDVNSYGYEDYEVPFFPVGCKHDQMGFNYGIPPVFGSFDREHDDQPVDLVVP